MTRTLLAVAACLLVFLCLHAPAAQACVSCEYTPEVVHSPVKGAAGKTFKRERTYRKAAEQRKARPTKKQVVRKSPAPAAKPDEAAAQTEETATKTENSTKTVDGQDELAASTAALDAKDSAASEPAASDASKEVGCKRFSPTAGTTVTVPCE